MFWREWLGKLTQSTAPQKLESQPTMSFDGLLDNLPFANQKESAERVKEFIYSLCESTLIGSEKLIRLIHLDAAVSRLSNLLCSRNSNEQTFQLAIELHQLLANAFKALAQEHQEKLRLDEFTQTIYYAVHQYKQLHARYYQLHQPVPTETWQDIYQLYALAEKNELLNPSTQNGSLISAFSSLFMLALANPYALTFLELEQLLKALPSWENKAIIGNHEQMHSQFIFSLNQDHGPIYREFLPKEAVDDSFRSFDLYPVLSHLETQINQIEKGHAGSSQHECSEHLARHLVQAWSSSQMRAEPRSIQTGRVRVLLGLAASSAFLRDQYGFKREFNTVNQSPAQEGGLRLADSVSSTQQVKAPPVVNAVMSGVTTSYQPKEWEIVNISDRGICICALPANKKEVIAGQIIAIQRIEDNQEPTWKIGIIRWVRSEAEELQIGIQLVCSDGFPVFIQNAHQKESGHTLAGLLSIMPEEPWHSSMLIAPSLPYQVDDIVYLNGQHYDMQVRLLTCLESSSYYKLFNYEVIEHIYQ